MKLGQKSVSDPTSHSHGQTSNPCIPVHIVCDSSEQVNCIGERSCAYGPSITHYHSQHEYIILDHQLDVTRFLRTITHMRHEIDWRVWFHRNTCVKKHEFQLSNYMMSCTDTKIRGLAKKMPRSGIEPETFRSSVWRSPNWAIAAFIFNHAFTWLVYPTVGMFSIQVERF